MNNSCPLCQQDNQCKANETCWCTQVTVPTALIEQLPEEFKDTHCICKSCVEKYHSTFSNAAKS